MKSEYGFWFYLIRINRAAWLLGASHHKTMQFNSKNESECGTDSCYRTSLRENQICKPGKLFFEKLLKDGSNEVKARQNLY